ncbi:cell wall hydrolase [Salipaludibacillus daqingensis]|uniref:cell wall hydrolase n=1 Tax=Salipaludibacillus daqingensis TaxID=3041001 RepID=UPI003CC83FBB
MMKRKSYRRLWTVVILLCFISAMNPTSVGAFSDQIIQKGATGDDVVELQARLQYNGFYDGTIDGVFGWQTYWSVKEFQEEFGLEVDGFVGTDMKTMLEKATEYDKEFVHRMLNEGRKFTYYGGVDKNIQKGPVGSKEKPIPPAEKPSPEARKEAPAPKQPQPEAPPEDPAAEETPAEKPPETPDEAPAPEEPSPSPEVDVPAPAEEEPVPQDDDINIEKAINVPEGYSDNDIRIMAQAVYGEARGEPYVGQVAVAAVILNRVESSTFPNTASDVIFEPRAFTAVADGQIWMDPDETSRKAVIDAINGQDPTGHALYYFNPVTATSDWIWSRPQIKQIGKHIFCK